MNIIAAVRETHIRRYRQIAEVLSLHGFGYLTEQIGLDRFSPTRHRDDGFEGPLSPAEHLRTALEELGPTFIKLGQLLSTRPDILPRDFIDELSKLQDDAPPFPGETAAARIEEEMGRPIRDLFAEFELKPIAAASIGQAHAARMFDGTEVIVKVRRPGVVSQIEEDLEILHNIAAVADRRWALARHYDLLGLTREFARTLRSELDYIHEGHNAERFAENFRDDASVHIPRIFWDTTTSRVLTLERIRGVKISDLDKQDGFRVDHRTLAERGTQVILKMVFEDGFFHADLHPGNFFIESDGRFGLIDFGMVGQIDEKTQDYLANLIMALTYQDYDRLTDSLLELEANIHNVDRRALRKDLERLIKPYYGKPLGGVSMTELFNEAFTLIRRHHLRLPPNLALLVKTIIIAEGLGTRLDPDFHLTTVIEPYADRLMIERLSPTRLIRKLGRAGLETARLSTEIPRQLRQILGEIERGGFEVGMKRGALDPFIVRLEGMVNRLVLGMLASAFIIGLATLLSVYHPPGWERWAGIMFAIGFVLAICLGIYLAWTILTTGRSKRD